MHVWHAHVDEVWTTGERWTRALAWLSSADRERCTRYRLDADRQMFVLGRLMARTLVGRALGVSGNAWTWTESERGRPEVGGVDGLSFNLAHSAGLVVCALSEHGPVGVDVEDRARRTVERQVVYRFCAPAEIADIEAQADAWHDQFLMYWTLKEAYLKARGLGIAVHLADVSFAIAPGHIDIAFLGSLKSADPRWAFALESVGDRYFMAAAAPSPDGRPTFTFAPLPLDWLPAVP